MAILASTAWISTVTDEMLPFTIDRSRIQHHEPDSEAVKRTDLSRLAWTNNWPVTRR
jgi:hypothetical protein